MIWIFQFLLHRFGSAMFHFTVLWLDHGWNFHELHRPKPQSVEVKFTSPLRRLADDAGQLCDPSGMRKKKWRSTDSNYVWDILGHSLVLVCFGHLHSTWLLVDSRNMNLVLDTLGKGHNLTFLILDILRCSPGVQNIFLFYEPVGLSKESLEAPETPIVLLPSMTLWFLTN